MAAIKLKPPRRPITILRRAYAFISDRSHWTQHAVARDKNGDPLGGAMGTKVETVCAVGALYRFGLRSRTKVYNTAHARLKQACEQLYGCSIPATNDRLGWVKVRRAFRLAMDPSKLKAVP